MTSSMWLTSPTVVSPAAAASAAAQGISLESTMRANGQLPPQGPPMMGGGMMPPGGAFGGPAPQAMGLFGAPPMGGMAPMPMNTGMGMAGFSPMPFAGGMGMSPLGMAGLGSAGLLGGGLGSSSLLGGGLGSPLTMTGFNPTLNTTTIGGIPTSLLTSTTSSQPQQGGLNSGALTALVTTLLSAKESKSTKTEAPAATTATTAAAPAPAVAADVSAAPPISTAKVGTGAESILNVTPEAQRSPIGCVPTAVTMALRYLGFNVSQSTLDAEMRPPGETASITDAVKAVERRGGHIGTYNNASFSDVKRALDNKQPVLAYIENGSSNDANLHCVMITGYYTDKKTGKQMLVITNPDGGKRQVMSYSSFQRQWQNLRVNNESTGFNQFMMVLSKADNLPASTLSGKALQVEKATYSRNQQARRQG